MPRFPIFRLGKEPEKLAPPELVATTPAIALDGLAVGVDNLRHDVALSPRFVDAARAQIMRLVVRHGELEGLLAAEAPQKSQAPSWMRDAAAGPNRGPVRGPADRSRSCDWLCATASWKGCWRLRLRRKARLHRGCETPPLGQIAVQSAAQRIHPTGSRCWPNFISQH